MLYCFMPISLKFKQNIFSKHFLNLFCMDYLKILILVLFILLYMYMILYCILPRSHCVFVCIF